MIVKLMVQISQKNNKKWTFWNLIEVLSGISSGERLVDAPSDRDLAGKRIEVQP